MWNYASLLNILGMISLLGNIYLLTDKYDISAVFESSKSNSADSLRRRMFGIENPTDFTEGLVSIRRLEAKKPDSMRLIGERTHTDKIYHHRYDRYYPKFLRQLRNKPMKMLEVGFLFGESYEMWSGYFPKGSVYFIDKGFSASQWENVKKRPDIVAKSFVGDQSLVSDLEKALDKNQLKGDLDFIIDDGSHYPDHQILTFKYFFEHGLKPGGVYIIEDIEQNYWYHGESYGYLMNFGKDHPKSIVTAFKKMVDVVNREFQSTKSPFESGLGQAVDKWVSSVTFGYNCIIITKMDEEEFGFAHRPYRYAENTTPLGKDAEDNYGKETSAALSLQRVFRGGRSRTGIAKKNFRGYYSRKYKQSMRKRKRYCQRISEEGEKVRKMMEKYSEEQIQREKLEARSKKENEFKTLAQNLHHLLSTRQISGIYNPYEEFLEKPTMNSMHVEEHIRGVVKDLLRTRGIAKTGLVTDIHGTKKIPLNILKYRISIQASAPFDTLKMKEREDKTLHKILTANKGNFLAGGRTALIDKSLQPLCVGEKYLDAWANPLLVKGVPRDTQQLLECARTQKPLFVTHQEKPFVSRVGGNKSTALPNDVFDTIADAQETGGAAQRHMGTTTSRFGLSQNSDRRADGVLPNPPLRTSALAKSTNTRIKKFTLGSINMMSKSAGHEPKKLPQKRTVKFDENQFTAFDDHSSVNSAEISSPLTADFGRIPGRGVASPPGGLGDSDSEGDNF